MTSDAVLLFLPGNHSLETSFYLSNLSSLTLAGDSSSLPQVTTSIVCSQEASISFDLISELFITDIALVSCGSYSSYTASVRLSRAFQTGITNCIFQGGQNGALKIFDSNVHLSHCKFDNNFAINFGGAVYIVRSYVNISENLFTNSSATSADGGGVYIEDSTANISGNCFINNHAKQGGGGVYLETSTVSFNSNLFKNNSARFGGGIAAYTNSNVSATNNTFTSNIASVGGGGIDIYIGVVASFMDNIFENNSAEKYGGGVLLLTSIVTFNNNLFKSNTATRFGGGIDARENSNVNATNNTFTRNIASEAGGGIFIFHRVVANLMGNIFEYNSAGQDGGGVSLESSTVNFHNNLFMNNTVSEHGGGIDVVNNSSVSATNNTFTRNFAGRDGGGISIESVVDLVANFMGNIIEYNSVQQLGGGVYVAYSAVSFSNNLFKNNTAEVGGGGIDIEQNSNVSATNNSFTSNIAGKGGGGISIETGVVVTFNNNLFMNNTASQLGGGIFALKNSTVIATNNTFTMNSAGVGGGGIAITDRVVANFMGNIIDNNIVQNSGGGVAVYDGSTASFTLDSFMFNTAVILGGGIWGIDSIIAINKCNLIGNSAGNRGGGSYLEGNAGIFRENVFANNSALFNGASIYIALHTNNTECTNNTFRNNWGGGWVLFIEDSNRTSAVISQNAFKNNTGNVVYGSSKETPSIYHITPSPDTVCPNEPCLTISEFIDQANQYITLTTTLMFLPGAHTVKRGLLVEGIASLTLLGTSSVESLPLIICDRPASLGFKYIDELLVRSLAFDSCGDGIYAAFSVKSVSRTEILDCSFKNSINSGGAVVVANCNMLLITENVFENNSAVVGGGLYVNESTINFIGNTFTNNIAALRGAGVALLNCHATYTGMVTFMNNSGVLNGREIVHSDLEFREGFLSLTHVGARFTGGAMFIYKSDVTFGEISVENNIATYGGGICVFGSTISFSGLTDFVNNHADDSGGAVYAIDSSQLTFEGTSSFKYNTALNGGGLYLADSSLCYFSVTALQLYLQNYARNTGGAIHVSDTTPSAYCHENSVSSQRLQSLCFFQIQANENLFRNSQIQTMINFSNNTANVGGGDLYGGTIDNCKLSKVTICLNICEIQSSGEVFNTITTGELDIASVPLRVCYCEHQTPDCSQPPSVKLYPGENFDVFVTVLGQRNATVPTVIRAQLSENIKIKEFQDTQKTTKSQLCSKLSFTVYSAESKHDNLTLYIDSPCDQNSLVIQIYMQRCPHGFQISTSTNTCICDERLTKKILTERCDIETGIVRPNGSEFWVSYDNNSDGLMLHPQCPFDYCTEVEQVVQVDDSDTQCNYNRTGKLCGGCGGNTSLVLGSSRCMQCSNSYLALIIPFALAGIALVLFLFILKLTVAVGTINGLIFYANIVQVNSSVFYKSVNTNILTVFISWLNLDLGIETCFYNGMDVYTKTWLQFVFPTYVWLLVGVIIFISHFSRKITSLLGSNPIAVLATLFLISYTKILRTIIAALSFTYLQFPDGINVAVWVYNGNMEYFGGKHTPLFITALLSLIFLFLPFTLLLFLGQWIQTLQAKTEWRILSWINKPTFRAFLDAYHAPYANSHRYWTGLLLLVRCILFVIFATNGSTKADLFAVSSAVTGLITLAVAAAGVYRKHYFGILEASFFCNLLLLTTATYHFKVTGGNHAAVTIISLSIAFMTFAGIVVYHVFLRIRGTKLWERVASLRVYCNRLSKSTSSSTAQLLGSEENIESHEASVSTTYVEVELREPLLDDD